MPINSKNSEKEPVVARGFRPGLLHLARRRRKRKGTAEPNLHRKHGSASAARQVSRRSEPLILKKTKNETPI